MSRMRKSSYSALLVAALSLLLLSALHLMSDAIQHSSDFSQWFVSLLVFTVGGLLVLAGLITFNLVQLFLDYRRHAAGSRLTARMVLVFVLITLAPTGVVYYYSMQFLHRGIDSWFSVEIDTAMEKSVELSRASLDLHKRQFLHDAEQILIAIQDSSQAALAISLGELRVASGAAELILMDKTGKVMASAIESADILIPDIPESAIIQQVTSGANFVGMTPYGGTGQLHVRCVVSDPLDRGLLLQAMYPTSERVSDLSLEVQDAYVAYKERVYLRDSLKFSFTLALSLVLLVGLFAAVWAAFFTARRFVAPIADIAEGTRAVAEGDYDKQLPIPRARDELGFLVSSFNAMTRRIAQARYSVQQSQRELTTQHAFLETVLGGLSSGVMTIDSAGRLQTANHAAEQILRIPLSQYKEYAISHLQEADGQLSPFVERIEKTLAGREDWREEVTLYRSEGRQVLLCRHSHLQFDDDRGAGHVFVFDDVTTLIKAQRDAAWGEVARRLAHEIKNPLTPIQLSAERLRRKYQSKLVGRDGEVLTRATDTIIQQVEAMKEMVNAFSDYAKPSELQPEPVLLDTFIAKVVALYEASGNVTLQPDAGEIRIEADPVRLRQVLHNLIKNAQEAVANLTGGSVRIATYPDVMDNCAYVEVSVEDNGPGFDADTLGQVFEPYITTKKKGTGLGLAIVKKIIEEHGGTIRAENVTDGGGRVVIRLPAIGMTSSQEDCEPLAGNFLEH